MLQASNVWNRHCAQDCGGKNGTHNSVPAHCSKIHALTGLSNDLLELIGDVQCTDDSHVEPVDKACSQGVLHHWGPPYSRIPV